MKYFYTHKQEQLPVSFEKFLSPYLNSTTEKTKYWERTNSRNIHDRQVGRVLLQFHQIVDILESSGYAVRDKSFLDIGTGNGFIPKLLGMYTDFHECIGTDAFLDGEHTTSWQIHDQNEGLGRIVGQIEKNHNVLSYSNYKEMASEEHVEYIPREIKLNIKKNDINYKFIQKGVHELSALNTKHDFLYCKAIEHIHDWELAFDAIREASQKGALIYLKHRSFFSYTGAHRYGSTSIPWGHLLLTDEEYKNYTKEYHAERKEEMDRFFFNDLSYPRSSVSDMVQIAIKKGFRLHTIRCEAPRFASELKQLMQTVPHFWQILKRNYPTVGSEELLSGMYHIVFKRI